MSSSFNSARRPSSVLGQVGERLAALHYGSRGYRILARNWRCRSGEIDIVASRDNEVVFCEVKTRSSLAVGYPEESVGYVKQKKLKELATEFLAAYRDVEDVPGVTRVRFDVASVIVPKSGPPEVTIFEDAF